MIPRRKLARDLVIFVALLGFVDITVDGVMSAFLNQMVMVTDCTEDILDTFMIDGKIWWQLPFSDNITLESSGPCNSLTFPAIPTSDQDIMDISFIYNGGPVNHTLRVQGELTQPGNFSFHDVNATHIILSWNEPFSWVQPSDVVYVLTQNGSYTSKTVELRTHSFPLLRPPGGLYARLTPWNPVGEGESSTLNLTDSVLGCDKISDFTPKALPYYNSGTLSVMVELFTLEESGKYCFPETVLVDSNGRETHSAIEIKDGKAVLFIHGVEEEMHVTATVSYWNSEFTYSTYKVQGITESGSSHEPIVECHFLDGSAHNTCYITVAGDESAFSGDARYTITRPPGQYTLLVYDDERQKNTGKDPALTRNITIEYIPRDPTDKGGRVFALLVLLIVPAAVVLVIAVGCWTIITKKQKRKGVELNHSTESGSHRSTDRSVHFATDDEKSALVTGNQLRMRPAGTYVRTDGNHDTELVIPMNRLPDQQVPPAGENPAEENLAGVRDEEREADVVQGAELPELHDVPQPAD